MDLNDYLVANVIGPYSVEVSCTVWTTMYDTAITDRDLFVTSVAELFNAPDLNCTTDADCENNVVFSIDNLWDTKYMAYLKAFDRFWSTQLCDGNPEKKTGIVNESYTVPTSSGGTQVLNQNVDYGNGVFIPALWEEYVEAIETFMCDLKKVWAKVNGDTFPRSQFEEFITVESQLP